MQNSIPLFCQSRGNKLSYSLQRFMALPFRMFDKCIKPICFYLITLLALFDLPIFQYIKCISYSTNNFFKSKASPMTPSICAKSVQIVFTLSISIQSLFYNFASAGKQEDR